LTIPDKPFIILIIVHRDEQPLCCIIQASDVPALVHKSGCPDIAVAHILKDFISNCSADLVKGNYTKWTDRLKV